MNEDEMTIKLKAVEVDGISCKGCFFVNLEPCPTINCNAKNRKDCKYIIWVEDK